MVAATALAPTDPSTFLAAGTAVVVVELVACLFPARGVARVDPLDSLRAQ